MTLRWSSTALALLALSEACGPRPSSGRRSVESAKPTPVAAALASRPPTAPLPRLRNCGLATPPRIELMSVFRGRAVVQKHLGMVKLRGAPRLLAEPEDFAEFYLGESAIDPRSLPATLTAMRGAKLNVLLGKRDCHPRLGKISAFAWADEEGAGWSPGSPWKNAARVFKHGQSFLVAELQPDCAGFGPVTSNDIEGYREWPQPRDLETPPGARPAIVQQALATLPDAWATPPLSYLHWTRATLGDASLLVLELRRDVAQGGPAGSWLGVWCVEADGGLVSLGPGLVPEEHGDAVTGYRHHLSVVGREGSLPIVLYAYFGFEPSSGRYAFFNPAMGPAPHIEPLGP